MHGYVIDATLYGNAARFMNGSCEPNLKQAPMRHDEPSVPRVLFRARRAIAAGEELTWRYGAESAAAGMVPNAYAVVRPSLGGGDGGDGEGGDGEGGSGSSSRSRRRRTSAHGGGASSAAPLFFQGGVRCFCGAPKCRGVL